MRISAIAIATAATLFTGGVFAQYLSSYEQQNLDLQRQLIEQQRQQQQQQLWQYQGQQRQYQQQQRQYQKQQREMQDQQFNAEAASRGDRGRMVGGFYVPPSRSQMLSDLLKR